MFTKWAVVAALLGFLSGCGASVPGLAALSSKAGGSRLQARIQVAGPAQGAAGYRTMAVVEPYTAQDIDYLRFELWRADPAGDVLEGDMQTPSGSNADQTVDWSHLKRNATYRLKIFALAGNGQLLNEGGSATVQELNTGTDDQMSIAITLRLADRTFDGKLHPVVRATSINPNQVNHLKVELKEMIGGTWVSQSMVSTPGGSGLSKTIDFDHLKRNTSYRVTVSAIRSNGNTVKAKTVDCDISNDDDVTVAVDL